MSNSLNLNLPYVAAAQSQKHVTVNESLRRIDAMMQLSVTDRTRTEPPTSPEEGDRHIVSVNPTGAWSGKAMNVAAYLDGAWVFFAPVEGWLSYVKDEAALIYFDGGAWQHFVDVTSLGDVTEFGVNASADDNNRLVVKAAASLFEAEGAGGGPTGDVRVVVSKASAPDTASHVFQNNFSGRAEFGLLGNDDFSIKTSSDGATFTEALSVRAADAIVDFAEPPLVAGAQALSISIPSVSAAGLVNLPDTTTRVFARGYAAEDDGGRAHYRAVSSQPTHQGRFQTADGRWWEMDEETPSALMFGAKGDGDTNDTAAIQNAIDYCALRGGGTVLFPRGRFLHTGLTVNDGSTNRGQVILQGVASRRTAKTQNLDQGSALVCSSPNAHHVHFDGCATPIVRDLTFYNDGTPTAGTALYFDTCLEPFVENVRIFNVYNGLNFHRGRSPSVNDLKIQDAVGDYGMRLSGTSGDTLQHGHFVNIHIIINETGGTYSQTTDGLQIGDWVSTTWWYGLGINKAKNGIVIGDGGTQDCPRFHRFMATETETMEEYGIWVRNGGRIYLDSCSFAISRRSGIYLDPHNATLTGGAVCSDYLISNTRIANNEQHGVRLSSCNGVRMENCVVSGNSIGNSGQYSAVYVDSPTAFLTMIGCRAGGNHFGLDSRGAQKRGLEITSAVSSQRLIVMGCDFEDNVDGTYSNAGAVNNADDINLIANRGFSSNLGRFVNVDAQIACNTISTGAFSNPGEDENGSRLYSDGSLTINRAGSSNDAISINGNGQTGMTIDAGGKMVSSGQLVWSPVGGVSTGNQQLQFVATNNSTIEMRYKGSDGTVRKQTFALS